MSHCLWLSLDVAHTRTTKEEDRSSGKIATAIKCAGKVMVIRLIKDASECVNIEDKAGLQIQISNKHILIQPRLKRDLIL